MLNDQLEKAIDAELAARDDELWALARDLWENPELALEEEHAAAVVAGAFADAGFAVTAPAHGVDTAFRAEQGEGSPTIVICCEYDALPGIGHACGHNIIAAIGLGAAAAVARVLPETGGRLVVLGTPAEERFGGKAMLIKAGALDGVDVAMMVHPTGFDSRRMASLAIAEHDVTYHGVAAHASAAPEQGINALDALVQAYTAIAALRQHIGPRARVHGIIVEGGEAPNIVPRRASGNFFVRAATLGELEKLSERVVGCFRAGEAATGARLEHRTQGEPYAEVRDNMTLAAVYERHGAALGRTYVPNERISAGPAGSTDMGNVSHVVPSIHPMVKICPPSVANHTEEFTVAAGSEAGREGLRHGAAALARTAVEYLADPSLREAVAAEFANP